MKIVRFDSVGGASGDMILAALIGLGADRARLCKELATLGIEAFDVRVEDALDRGLTGKRVTVSVSEAHGHPHRSFGDIRAMIEKSRLPARAREMSLRVFRRLAESEGRIHGVDADHVHFHEVGAMDSIIDIVGSCLALEWIGAEGVSVGPLPAGTGTIEGAHGVMPNPAPATVDLLCGHEMVLTDEPFELVTPTAAAWLMTWEEASAGRMPVGSVQISAWANAIGHRTLHRRANILRATLLEPRAGAPVGEDCLVLECNLDDVNPEWIGALVQRLMDLGALDVFTTAVQMKKQRPGILLTVLCLPEGKAALEDAIFRESTTFGLREYPVRRTMLDRRHEDVETPYGRIRVKIGVWKGQEITRAPEYEDCARCARAHSVPVRTVYEAAIKA